jgi:hypothetical protein
MLRQPRVLLRVRVPQTPFLRLGSSTQRKTRRDFHHAASSFGFGISFPVFDFAK